MKFIGYIFSIAFLRVLSILPMFIIYFFSDLLYLILYYLVGYRRKVVIKNLALSFPEYSKKEVMHTTRKFYRHLADIILESAVSLYFSRRRLEKMIQYTNPEMIDKYVAQGRSIIINTSHYNNWELSVTLSYTVQHQLIALYKPLKNKYFDKAIQKARRRFGARTVPMKQISKELINCKNKGELTVTGIACDQRPIKQRVQHWTKLLGQNTPVFLGTEKLAKKFDIVVMYMKMRKVKRGLYLAEFELITDQPKETQQYEITEKQISILEQLIREEPAHWLWSHDLWKYPSAPLRDR